VVARVGPVAEMILIVEDAVRFDVADSAPRAAIHHRSRKMSATRRWRLVVEQPLEKSEIAHGRGWSVWGRVTPMPGGAHTCR